MEHLDKNIALRNLLDESMTPISVATTTQRDEAGEMSSRKVDVKGTKEFSQIQLDQLQTYEDFQNKKNEILEQETKNLNKSGGYIKIQETINELNSKLNLTEEVFYKKRLAIFQLSTDQDVIEQNREIYKIKLMELRKINSNEAEEIINLEFETLKESEEYQNERRRILKIDIVKNQELFSSLYKSFKLGNFDGLFLILSKMLNKFKLVFLQIYHSIPGMLSKSTIEMGTNLFGEDFFGDKDTLKTARMYDDAEVRKFLKNKMDFMESDLSDTIKNQNKINMELEKTEQLKALKENNKNLIDNTKATNTNNDILKNTKKESAERIFEVQQKTIIDVFGNIQI